METNEKAKVNTHKGGDSAKRDFNARLGHFGIVHFGEYGKAGEAINEAEDVIATTHAVTVSNASTAASEPATPLTT